MNPLQIASASANALALVLAVWIARRTPAHRPIAALCAACLVSLGLHLLAGVVLAPWAHHVLEAPAGVRIVFHADQARLLAWHLGCAATIAHVLEVRRAWRWALIAFPILAAAGVLVPMREAWHGPLYALAAACSVAVGIWAAFIRNGGERWAVEQRTALALVPGELVAMLTYLRNPWKGAGWHPAQAVYLVAFLAALAVQGGALWSGGMRRR
jgi:hypothetical protein